MLRQPLVYWICAALCKRYSSVSTSAGREPRPFQQGMLKARVDISFFATKHVFVSFGGGPRGGDSLSVIKQYETTAILWHISERNQTVDIQTPSHPFHMEPDVRGVLVRDHVPFKGTPCQVPCEKGRANIFLYHVGQRAHIWSCAKIPYPQ